MLLKKMATLILALSISSCSGLKNQNNSSRFSQRDDQYWANLVQLSIDSKTSILSIIHTQNPSLSNQIVSDSKDPLLLSFWGKSLNFDSGAKKKILDDQLISDLQELFGIKNDNMVVHAGITHTYGYLFSTLETPYGFKRKRWVEPSVNYAFSLNGNSLSPETIQGGMLSNITFFAGSIAFKNASDKSALKNLKNVSNEILNFEYNKLSIDVLEEQILGGAGNLITLRTTFVPFAFKATGEENDYLLIYSIYNPKLKKEFLITVFPIKKDAYKKTTAADSFGDNQAISIRYNAYLDGLMELKLIGTRKLIQDSIRH